MGGRPFCKFWFRGTVKGKGWEPLLHHKNFSLEKLHHFSVNFSSSVRPKATPQVVLGRVRISFVARAASETRIPSRSIRIPRTTTDRRARPISGDRTRPTNSPKELRKKFWRQSWRLHFKTFKRFVPTDTVTDTQFCLTCLNHKFFHQWTFLKL
jgi:hypothetical protein